MGLFLGLTTGIELVVYSHYILGTCYPIQVRKSQRAMAKKSHNTAIAEAVEFTSNDLTHNRRGELSAEQQYKLKVVRDVMVSNLEESPLQHIPSIITLVAIKMP